MVAMIASCETSAWPAISERHKMFNGKDLCSSGWIDVGHRKCGGGIHVRPYSKRNIAPKEER